MKDTETPAPVAPASATPETLPIAGTVPTPKVKKPKKAKTPRRHIRPYGFVAEGLTETQGKTLEALQIWQKAETNPRLMAELDAFEQFQHCMYEADRGTLFNFCEHSGISEQDARTLARTFKVWYRWVKENQKRTRKMAKGGE